MHVKEIMTSRVFTIDEDQTLNEAARLMWEHDIGSVPVLGKDNRVSAILTDRDIAMASYFSGRPLADIPVSTAASATELVCCRPDDEIKSVEKLMRENQVHRIPVTGDDAELVGIVSLNDIARAYAAGNKAVPAKNLSDTLAAICSSAGRKRVEVQAA